MDQFAFFYMLEQIVEDAFVLPLYGFNIFVKDQVPIDVWDNFRVFNCTPLIDLSVSVPIPCVLFCFIIIAL